MTPADSRIHWTWQFGKLSEAVRVLATHSGDVRHRVWAAVEHLNKLHVDMIPQCCSEDLRSIQAGLTKYPATELHESAMEATFHRTRNKSAVKIADRIWKMYRDFQSELESQEHAEGKAISQIEQPVEEARKAEQR